MDLQPCFKVRNLVVQLNSTRLGHMTNLKVIFHMVVSIYKLDTICNSTHSFAQPRSGCNKRISNLVMFVKRFIRQQRIGINRFTSIVFSHTTVVEF